MTQPHDPMAPPHGEDPAPPATPAAGYAFDPLTGQPVAQPYPAQPYPGYAQPGYAVHQPYPPQGTPAQFAPVGYGYPMPVPAVRPGSAVAVAVLEFIQAATVLMAAISLLGAADTVGWIGRGTSIGTEITLVAIVTIAAGGLLIAGGVQVLGGRTTLSFVGCGLSLLISAYWLFRLLSLTHGHFEGSAVGLILMMSILPIICLAMLPSVNRWARERSEQRR